MKRWLSPKYVNIFFILFSLTLSSIILYSFGRSWYCPVKDLALWSFDVYSQHNSQHLIDWYTPSHISHGFFFFLFFRLIIPSRLKDYNISLTVFVEAFWEVLENSSFIIERYRKATLALNYYGDSILNSLSDIGFCLLGYWLASKLKVKQVVIIFFLFEITTLIFIRDGLLLNILMLVHPVEAIKKWQLGG